MKEVLKAAWPLWLLIIVAAVFIGHAQPSRGGEPIINCKDGHANQPLVRDFDRRLWRIDICAVAQDDAGASQYKTEVR